MEQKQTQSFSTSNMNHTLYPPGQACDAMNGCPINQHCWSIVDWYPGKTTVMRCFFNHLAAIQHLIDIGAQPAKALEEERQNILRMVANDNTTRNPTVS